MQLLHLFGALAKSLLQKPPGLPFRLLLLPYSHRRDMSRMCCSFCSLLPTFCVPTKETNWDFYEQNAKGGTLVVGHYISTLSREVGA